MKFLLHSDLKQICFEVFKILLFSISGSKFIKINPTCLWLVHWLFCNDFFFIFLTFIYFWDRERQSMNGGGSKRGRHRIWNRLQALSCQHRVQRGARTHRPRDHDLSWSRMLNRPSHPGARLLILRETEKARMGDGQKERERENPKQAPHCQCRARQGAQTHELWDHDLRQSWTLNQLSHPGAPTYSFYFFWILILNEIVCISLASTHNF